jgi:hypothetical protein
MELWVSPKECANLSLVCRKHRLWIYVAKSKDGKTALEQGTKGGKAIEYKVNFLPVEAKAAAYETRRD